VGVITFLVFLIVPISGPGFGLAINNFGIVMGAGELLQHMFCWRLGMLHAGHAVLQCNVALAAAVQHRVREQMQALSSKCGSFGSSMRFWQPTAAWQRRVLAA
jgi:hypothetical protein